MPPHSTPPLKPGIAIVSLSFATGVNTGPFFMVASLARASALACGVRLVRVSGVTECRPIGAGRTGIGWVLEATSPSTSDAGCGTSLTSNSGLPVLRSKMKTKPALLLTVTASTARPLRRTVCRIGGVAKS